MAIWLKLYI